MGHRPGRACEPGIGDDIMTRPVTQQQEPAIPCDIVTWSVAPFHDRVQQASVPFFPPLSLTVESPSYVHSRDLQPGVRWRLPPLAGGVIYPPPIYTGPAFPTSLPSPSSETD